MNLTFHVGWENVNASPLRFVLHYIHVYQLCDFTTFMPPYYRTMWILLCILRYFCSASFPHCACRAIFNAKSAVCGQLYICYCFKPLVSYFGVLFVKPFFIPCLTAPTRHVAITRIVDVVAVLHNQNLLPPELAGLDCAQLQIPMTTMSSCVKSLRSVVIR